jgi:clan AA aspartic protease (TIGR02281 family)
MKGTLRRRSRSISALTLAFFSSLPSAKAERVDVAEELERLAADHGFSIKGLEQVKDAVGRAEGEDVLPRLRRLLEGFDHVILQAPEGGVERIIILGAKVPYEPPPPSEVKGAGDQTAAEPTEDGSAEAGKESGEIVLETIRNGSQHTVKISLEGKDGKRFDQSLLIDTGADQVVLPASLAAKLGLVPDELNEREMQTANGKLNARFGKIAGLWLGGTRLPNIDAAFIEDGKLGNGGLLGMSVLGSYTLTIDDEQNRLTLSRK